MRILYHLVENGYAPDGAVRYGIRHLLKMRLREIDGSSEQKVIDELKHQPIAVATEAANEQHYELPAQFFSIVLGDNLKYSSAYYENGATSLSEAEAHMLDLYIERADLRDGQTILDMGCGWGSLSLWVAQRFPNSQIVSVSNSHSQKQFVDTQISRFGLRNIRVITADMNKFEPDQKFDRIVSIEMFEHMRNYQRLFDKISAWIKDDGKLFVHIFCHKERTYYFEAEGDHNWMGKYFFTGGIMPSFDLYEKVQNKFKVVNNWTVNGTNYQKTAEAWLLNMDDNRENIMKIMVGTYGPEEANIWFQRWRIFFASCAELFGFNEGKEWYVGHYLFEKVNSNV